MSQTTLAGYVKDKSSDAFLMLLMLTSGLAFALKKSVNAAVIVLFMWGLWFLVSQRNARQSVSNTVLVGLLILTAQSVLTLLLWPAQGELNLAQLNENLRYLGCVPAYFVMRRFFRGSHFVALTVSFAIAVVWVVLEHRVFAIRPEGFSRLLNANTAGIFGSVAVSYFLALTLYQRLGTKLRLASASVAVLSMVLLIDSQTRSAWGACVVAVLLLSFALMPTWKARLASLASLVVLVAALFESVEKVSTRYEQAVSDATQWFSGGFKDTPLGIRFSLFVGAYHLALEKPIVGHSHTDQLKAVSERGLTELSQTPVSQEMWLISGVHSQYLDRLVTHGLLGGLLAALAYLWPVVMFVCYQRRARNADVTLHAFPMLLFGMCTGLCCFINGLSLNLGYKYVCSFMGLAFAFSLLAVSQLESDLSGQSS